MLRKSTHRLTTLLIAVCLALTLASVTAIAEETPATPGDLDTSVPAGLDTGGEPAATSGVAPGEPANEPDIATPTGAAETAGVLAAPPATGAAAEPVLTSLELSQYALT